MAGKWKKKKKKCKNHSNVSNTLRRQSRVKFLPVANEAV